MIKLLTLPLGIAALLTGCGEIHDSKCVETRTVVEILSVKGRDVAVKYDDGQVLIEYSPHVAPGDKKCVRYE